MAFFTLNAQVKPLPQAHAHNDYEHTRPLLDALDNRFNEVEADVFLIDGELYVSHIRPLFKDSSRTLRNLYLRPLRARIQQNKGWVYAGHQQLFYLMIDFKTQGDSTYKVLQAQLQEFEAILAQTNDPAEKPIKPVKVFISGNRPNITQILRDTAALAALDGRPGDLGQGIPNTYMPVVSLPYREVLQWRGRGKAPYNKVPELKQLIEKTHQEGKKLRLWGMPDNPKVWAFLLEMGIDLINTDKLEPFRLFMEKRS